MSYHESRNNVPNREVHPTIRASSVVDIKTESKKKCYMNNISTKDDVKRESGYSRRKSKIWEALEGEKTKNYSEIGREKNKHQEHSPTGTGKYPSVNKLNPDKNISVKLLLPYQRFAPSTQNNKYYKDILLHKMMSIGGTQRNNLSEYKSKSVDTSIEDYLAGGNMSHHILKSKSCLRVANQSADNMSKSNKYYRDRENENNSRFSDHNINNSKYCLDRNNTTLVRPFPSKFKNNNYSERYKEGSGHININQLYTKIYHKLNKAQPISPIQEEGGPLIYSRNNQHKLLNTHLIQGPLGVPKYIYKQGQLLEDKIQISPEFKQKLNNSHRNSNLFSHQQDSINSRNKNNMRKNLTYHICLPNIIDKMNIHSPTNTCINNDDIFDYKMLTLDNKNILPSMSTVNLEYNPVNIFQNNYRHSIITDTSLKLDAHQSHKSILKLNTKEKAQTTRIQQNIINGSTSKRALSKRNNFQYQLPSSPIKNSNKNISSIVENFNESFINKMKNIKHIRNKQNINRERQPSKKLQSQSTSFQNKYFMAKRTLLPKSNVISSFEEYKNEDVIEVNESMKPIEILDNQQVMSRNDSLKISKLLKKEEKSSRNFNLSIAPLSQQLPHKQEIKSIINTVHEQVEESLDNITDKLIYKKKKHSLLRIKKSKIHTSENIKYYEIKKRNLNELHKIISKKITTNEEKRRDNNLFGKDAICSWEQNEPFSDYNDEFGIN